MVPQLGIGNKGKTLDDRAAAEGEEKKRETADVFVACTHTSNHDGKPRSLLKRGERKLKP